MTGWKATVCFEWLLHQNLFLDDCTQTCLLRSLLLFKGILGPSCSKEGF